MPREIKTPLTLWICAAVCVHYLFGEGGSIVARNHDDRSNLWALSRNARERVRQEEQTMEIALADGPDATPIEEPKEEPEQKPDEPKKKKDDPKVEAPKPPTPPKREEEKKKLVVKPTDDKTKPPTPKDPLQDKRIAVRQHVKPEQQDNPNARFVGDEANHVDQETAATQTSHDRDDENPTPGGNHAGPQQTPGDSDRTKIAESEEHKGEKNRAPGERGTEFDIQKMPKPSPQPQTSQEVANKPQPPSPKATPHGNDHAPNPNPTPPQPAPPAPATAQAQAPTPPGTEPAPDLQESPNGTWSPGLFRPGYGGTPMPSGSAGIGRVSPTPGPTGMPQFGTGQRLFRQSDITAIVGQDNLRKMREAEGERRKSEHRGSWVASNFERWRSAIENYVSNVKPGNQTALNTAAVPFASYLSGMHNRIHPLFADNFLGSLDALPKTHPLNDQHLITRLEIVLTRDGHLQKMGIVKTSGVTAFDIAALDAVHRAQPFGPAPKAIISPDGNVYLHWEFHRDEVYACSTMNARPYLLNVQPPNKLEPQPPPAAPTPPTKEHELPPANLREMREGALPRPPRQG